MKKPFSVILQVGGVLFFLVIVAFTVLFVEGYEINIKSHEIVRKGVIYFEGGPNNSSLLVDGKKVDIEFPGEIRISPGPHSLKIEQKGYYPWEKSMTVPEDEVVRFFRVILLSDSENDKFIRFKENNQNWIMQSSSSDGVTLFQPKLHIVKFFPLNSSDVQFWLQDIPFSFNKLIAFHDKRMIGLATNGKLFSFNPSKQSLTFSKDLAPFSEIYSDGKRVFGFQNDTIWEIDEDSLAIKLIAKLSVKNGKISEIMQEDDYTLFIVDAEATANAYVISKEGLIAFESDGINGAFLEDKTLWFVKQKNLISYDLKERKYIKNIPVQQSIIWFSRIEKTFHFLILTLDNNILFCDEDVENCHPFAKLDGPFIQASINNGRFFTKTGDKHVLFDFTEDSFLPRFLENLVSAVL